MNNVLPIIGFCYNDNPSLLRKVCRVLRYTSGLILSNPDIMHDLDISYTRPTIFSFLPPPELDWSMSDPLTWIQIPPLDRAGFLVFYSKTMPFFLPDDAENILHVGDDGFISNPRSWSAAFSKCDYIGAPWEDGAVGNDGFSLQSRRWVTAMSRYGWVDGTVNPDYLFCRDANWIERNKLTVASTETAEQFSSELRDNVARPFGFHGHRHGEKHYAEAWKRLEGWEILNGGDLLADDAVLLRECGVKQGRS